MRSASRGSPSAVPRARADFKAPRPLVHRLNHRSQARPKALIHPGEKPLIKQPVNGFGERVPLVAGGIQSDDILGDDDDQFTLRCRHCTGVFFSMNVCVPAFVRSDAFYSRRPLGSGGRSQKRPTHQKAKPQQLPRAALSRPGALLSPTGPRPLPLLPTPSSRLTQRPIQTV